MTYAEFKASLKASAMPDKESSRLTARHDGWIASALIEIQQKVPCLKGNHREYISQEATYYSCGATAFPIPAGGYVRELRVQQIANRCNYVECIPMTEAVFRGILQNMQACRCHAIVDSTPAYLAYYGYEYDYGEYDYGDYDPELRPATPAIDLRCHARNRAFAIFEGNVWLWPVLNSTETAVLKWHGVKKNWRDIDPMPDDGDWVDETGALSPEITEVVQLYFMMKRYRYDLCDIQKAQFVEADYRKKVSEMITECRRKDTLPELVHVIPQCPSLAYFFGLP
jgi:hypothetical protein